MTPLLPTLMLALLGALALLTLALGLSRQLMAARPELHRWATGCWALLAGVALLAVEQQIPPWLSQGVGALAVCAGVVLYAQALYRLVSQREAPRWMLGVLVAAPLAMLTTLEHSLAQRLAVLSLLVAVLLGPSLALILRQRRHVEPSLGTVAATLATVIVALLVGAALGWTEPASGVGSAHDGPVLMSAVAFIGVLGASVGFMLAVAERLAGQVAELGMRDALTGCLNRNATDTMLAHQLQHSKRLGKPVAFELLDLDRVRQINDRHGHRIGDLVLMKAAHAVRDRLRESDVMGRTGGEEFGLILPATDLFGARRLTDDIRRAVASIQMLDDQGQAVSVTVSTGVAVAAPDDEIAVEHLYARADKAQYTAKRDGRNRVAQYDDSAARGFSS